MADSNFMLDPVASYALGAALSVVFLAGSWHKLRDPALFQANVDNYRLLPPGLTWAVAMLLSIWELAAGVFLLFGSTRDAGAALTLGLLLVVTAAVIVNLLRGHTEIDCGCGSLGGHVGDQTLSWGLASRNAVLICAAALVLAQEKTRMLAWIDYASVAGATLGLLGIYAIANQLMANEPRLQALRNH